MHVPPPPAPSILDSAGATPVVRLDGLAPRGTSIRAKLECLNPSGSAADRLCAALLSDAERTQKLRPGGTVVVATLGNTGIALAQACAVRGHPLVVCLPESMSLERRALLRAWGAKVVLTPAEEHLDGARRRAQQLAAELPGAAAVLQSQVEVLAEAQRRSLGAELVEQILADGGRVDAFVAAVGTGGTLLGVGRALKARFPRVRIAAVIPEAAGPHRMQGLIGRDDALALTRGHVSATVEVSDRDAWEMKQRLGAEHGLLVGISSGATVLAATRLAAQMGPGARVYTVCWDTGERYFSLAERFR